MFPQLYLRASTISRGASKRLPTLRQRASICFDGLPKSNSHAPRSPYHLSPATAAPSPPLRRLSIQSSPAENASTQRAARLPLSILPLAAAKDAVPFRSKHPKRL